MKQNYRDWFKTFEDFLDIAELINKEIADPKHKEDLCKEGDDILSRQNEVNFRGPLLYIFKHSIELFLKSGITYINDGCLNSSHFHHDIKKLLNVFKEDLSQNKDVSLSTAYLEKLENIVDKYYDLGMIDVALSGDKDAKNTATKYPSNKKIDRHKFWYGLDNKKLGERVAEIEENMRNLRMIGSELRGHVF